jgi:hypothetical protein
MSLPAIILLASLGPATTIQVPKMGTHHVFFKAAPRSGDLVRNGLHPLAVLISDHRHKADQFQKLYHGLGVGGFNRVALTIPKSAKQGAELLEAVLNWSLKQPQVDRERIYMISSVSAGIVAIQQATKQPDGIQGLIWLSPVLQAAGESVLPLLSKLSPMPMVLTADVRDQPATSATNTLRTVLKIRFPDVRRIRRAQLGQGAAQLQRSATLADQLIITLRTWAEKNCDRTAPKKKTLNEGCKK